MTIGFWHLTCKKMARKLPGMEGPRNSLEVQVENRQRKGEGRLRGLEWPDGSCYPTKSLVNGDNMYSRNINGGGTPSIVARLMGVDALPPLLDTISLLRPTCETRQENNQFTSSRKDQLDHFYPKTDHDADQWCNNQTIRREHPQEEQLQKFKREFEAWQASRFKQCSRVAEIVVNIAGHLASPHLRIQNHNSNMEQDCVSSTERRTSFTDDGEMQSCAPNKIVILKPAPDDCQDSLASSSSSPAEDRGSSIANFLEEVKQRLKSEVEGKKFQTETLSGWDTNANLVRSESTRSSRREMQSTELMNRNTRRFLSDRLRNIVRKRTSLDVRGSSGSSQLEDTSRSALVHWEIMQEEEEEEEEMQTRSFRHEDEASPRNLMRSLSAPVSFGKLLLEDRHILTGAHIRRKHEEALDTVSEDQLRNGKKERFNIKQKVSSFKHNLSLRGKMFRKRFQRVESCNYGKDIHIVNNTRQLPTVANIGERQITIMDNSTEVPPSPASICSSAQEDFWRPSSGYVSPVSTPDVTLEDETGMPQVFRDICSNLKELRRQINRLGSTDDEETGPASSVDCREEENVRLEPLSGRQTEDKAEALYIRDLLIASGLFDGLSSTSKDMCLLPSRSWDPLGKPIPNSVFEQVEEEASRKKWDQGKDNDEMIEMMRSDVDRKMLYDLLNEALTTVIIPAGRQTFSTTATTTNTLRGTKLLERVWKMIQEYVYPLPYGSDAIQNSVVERQMGSITSWSCEDEGLDELGKEIEFLIVEDMINETVKELI